MEDHGTPDPNANLVASLRDAASDLGRVIDALASEPLGFRGLAGDDAESAAVTLDQVAASAEQAALILRRLAGHSAGWTTGAIMPAQVPPDVPGLRRVPPDPGGTA